MRHRDRERQVGSAYGFGLFVDNAFAGEININNVVRGAFQCGVVGYWIDQRHAGNRYIAEGVAVICRFAFDELHLHRLEICIVPRNTNSRRVMEVLDIREEGVALRYLEINGAWEDHIRYAITAEEWDARPRSSPQGPGCSSRNGGSASRWRCGTPPPSLLAHLRAPLPHLHLPVALEGAA